MSHSKREVTVCTEIDTLLSVVAMGIADVRGGRPAEEVVTHVGPALLSALTGLGELESEVKDRASLERTVALRVCDIVDAIVS